MGSGGSLGVLLWRLDGCLGKECGDGTSEGPRAVAWRAGWIEDLERIRPGQVWRGIGPGVEGLGFKGLIAVLKTTTHFSN